MVGEEQRLRQVLKNLLANAVKFTASGSVALEVDTVGNPGRLRLRVMDSSIGIEPEVLPRLFKPFAQADASITRGCWR